MISNPMRTPAQTIREAAGIREKFGVDKPLVWTARARESMGVFGFREILKRGGHRSDFRATRFRE